MIRGRSTSERPLLAWGTARVARVSSACLCQIGRSQRFAQSGSLSPAHLLWHCPGEEVVQPYWPHSCAESAPLPQKDLLEQRPIASRQTVDQETTVWSMTRGATLPVPDHQSFYTLLNGNRGKNCQYSALEWHLFV